MKELDRILNKHLPDDGLCKRGKQLNRQRKERLKLDLIAYFKSGVFDDMIILPTAGTLVVDEKQLNV